MAKGKGKQILKRKKEVVPDDLEVEPSNESKQKKSWAELKIAKRLNFNNSLDSTTGENSKMSGKKEKPKKSRVTAKFVENGDEVLFEVEGQATDFQEEGELNSDSEEMKVTESESDSKEEVEVSINNNAN